MALFIQQIGRLRDGGAVERFTSAPGARHDFRFSRTFDENSTQCEVFETVARKIVDRFVEGYNGTVFAYGQTSTGKTYTVEGSVGGEGERGLVPRFVGVCMVCVCVCVCVCVMWVCVCNTFVSLSRRTLSYLYPLIEEKKKKLLMNNLSQIEDYSTRTNTPQSERELEGGGVKVRVHISYMEIYQDTGYDLLNPGARPGSLMLTLPKVCRGTHTHTHTPSLDHTHSTPSLTHSPEVGWIYKSTHTHTHTQHAFN